MTPQDHASITLLTAVAAAIASVDGPIGAETAAAALGAVKRVIQSRGDAISMQTLDAIVALIEAVRDEITS